MVQRLVFQVEQALDVLAEMVPAGAELADQAKGLVRGLMKQGLGLPSEPAGRSSFQGPSEGGTGNVGPGY